jgi:hypothetical protein
MKKRILLESVLGAEERLDNALSELLDNHLDRGLNGEEAIAEVLNAVDAFVEEYRYSLSHPEMYESKIMTFEDLLEQRKVIKESTDYIEVGEIIYGTMKPGKGYSYGDIEAMANRQAGENVSMHVESAIQYLESNGDITAAARPTAMGVPGGRNYAYMYYKV